MGNSPRDPAALAGVAIAAVVSLALGEGYFGVYSTVVGLTLLFVLLAYDPIFEAGDETLAGNALIRTVRFISQHLAFSAVYALCIFMAVAWFFMNPALDEPTIRGVKWPPPPEYGEFQRVMIEMLIGWGALTLGLFGLRAGSLWFWWKRRRQRVSKGPLEPEEGEEKG